MTTLSFVFPSRRPDRLRDTLESFRDTTATYDVEALVVADTEEVAAAAVGLCDKLIEIPPSTSTEAWNYGAAASTGEWIGLGADDLLFRPGWIQAAWPLLTLPWGVVGLDDGAGSIDRIGWSTHWIASRQFCIEHMGGLLVPPVYRHDMIDAEVCAVAMRKGLFVYAEGALVEHMHPDWGKAETDATYQEGDDSANHDRRIFGLRSIAGFPVTWEPMIEPVKQPKRRVHKPIDKA